MKSKHLKPLILATILPFLTGCAFLNNIVSNIALNYVFGSEFILNKVSLGGPDGMNLEAVDPKPTTEANAVDITYGISALAIPNFISLTQMGVEVEITFTVEFLTAAHEDLFYNEEFALSSEEELTVSANVYYPIGNESAPESLEEVGDWLTFERLKDLKNEEDALVGFKVVGTTANNKKKTQTYYTSLSGDAISIPGDGDVTINEDYAIWVEEENVGTTLDVTLDKDELSTGITVPLQIFWIDFNRVGETTTGVISVSHSLDLMLYDVTHAGGPQAVTVNDTIVDYSVLIKLKTGETPPSTDPVVTFTAILTITVPA